MGVHFRKRMRIGPVILHFTDQGLSSWSLKVGPWSWNSRRRAQRVDLPGPWHWTGSRRSKKTRSETR